MRHEKPEAFGPNLPKPSSVLKKIEAQYGCGPIAGTPNQLTELADLYEKWVAVYRFAGDVVVEDDASRVITANAVRRLKELMVLVSECPAQNLTELGRKARILREYVNDWWAEGEQPLARSLCMDVLRLADMAPPIIPNTTPLEVLEQTGLADQVPA